MENQVHTGWLDARIAARVRVERPPWHLSVIAGAVHCAFNEAAANVAEVRKATNIYSFKGRHCACSGRTPWGG